MDTLKLKRGVAGRRIILPVVPANEDELFFVTRAMYAAAKDAYRNDDWPEWEALHDHQKFDWEADARAAIAAVDAYRAKPSS
jgi:hypothetical protein